MSELTDKMTGYVAKGLQERDNLLRRLEAADPLTLAHEIANQPPESMLAIERARLARRLLEDVDDALDEIAAVIAFVGELRLTIENKHPGEPRSFEALVMKKFAAYLDKFMRNHYSISHEKRRDDV